MLNRGSIIRYVSVCIICTSVIFLNSINFLTAPVSVSGTAMFFENSGELDVSSKTEETTESASAEAQAQKQETEAIEEKAEETVVETASTGTVKGKILEQTITTSSANLIYNNVHVKNSSGLDVSIKNLLEEALCFGIDETDAPQVLIMHTHTTETYMKTNSETYTTDYTSRTRDDNYNMVKIGGIVTQKLNEAGIVTLHDKTQHDYPKYTGSYSRSAQTICSYLEKYPSIKIVIDLHRDAIASGDSDKVKLTADINGEKAAQVMLVMGSQAGSVTNFPNWQQNLKLALRLQQIMEVKYPTLARPLSLTAKNYNQSLTTGSILIEIGTDANTVNEACLSAKLVGECLVELLNTI